MAGSNLFIGVGGSGAATLRWLYNDLRQRLEMQGWPWAERSRHGRAMPACWRFIEIDVDDTGTPSDVPTVHDGAITRVALAKAPDQMTNIYASLQGRNLAPEATGWLPQPHEMRAFNPYEGAGQYRAIGRAVALARIGDIVTTLSQEATRISSPEAMADLSKLAQIGISIDHDEKRAILVSSLSGGSGSGIWLDVAQWLASRPSDATQGWMSQQQYAFLYLPEVHSLISGPSEGLAPNSLLAAAEMLSAYADRGPYSTLSERWRSAMGIAPNQSAEKGPRNLYLIGASNSGGVAYASLRQVYQATAQALSSVVMSHGKSFSRIAVNDQPPPPKVPFLRSTIVTSSNIGYARLDLGRESFGEYATRRIYRNLMLQLLYGHRLSKATEHESDRAVIERLADAVQNDFFAQARLYERDSNQSKNDQILDAMITRPSIEQLADSALRDVAVLVKRTVEGLRGDADRQGEIRRRFPALRDVRLAETQLQILQNAARHADVVRRQLLSAVAEYSSAHSVPVVRELLDRLDTQLEDAQRELTAKIGQGQNEHSEKLELFLRDIVRNQPSSRLSVLSRIHMCRYEAAVAFIRNVRFNLVKPTVGALDDWMTRVSRELVKSSEGPTVFEWNGRDVPTDLYPAPNTVTIEPVENFSSRFEELVSNVFNSGGLPIPVEDAMGHCLKEIVLFQWPNVRHDNDGDRRCLESTGQLFLDERAAFSMAAVADRASGLSVDADTVPLIFDMFAWFCGNDTRSTGERLHGVSYIDLLDTTREWVFHREGALSEFVNEGFGGWLDDSKPDHIDRQTLFLSSYSAALRRAAPLVSYDLDTLGAVIDGGSVKERLVVAPEFPIPPMGPIATALQTATSAAVTSLSLPESDFSVGTGDTSQIELLRTFDMGLHPLAFSSLTRSITEQFGLAGPSFWKHRRARNLAATTMLTPAQLLAFVRGWQLALMLNRVDPSRGAVWLDGGWEEIPGERLHGDPSLLGSSGRPGLAGWLKVALESLPLRFMMYPTDNEALKFYTSMTEFGGYKDGLAVAQEELVGKIGIERLATFGEQNAKAQNLEHFHFSSPALLTWVEMGICAPGAPTPKPDRLGSSDQSPAQRRSVTVERLVRQLNEYEVEYAALRAIAELPPTLRASQELSAYFVTAISQILRSLDGPGIEVNEPEDVE